MSNCLIDMSNLPDMVALSTLLQHEAYREVSNI